LRSVAFLLLASATAQLVLSPKALEELRSSASPKVVESTSPPERKLFLVSQATIDEKNFEARTQCTYFNESKMSWPTWSSEKSKTIS